MQFIKTRDVKNPERDVNENAGIDFYIPENNEDFQKALKEKNYGIVIGDFSEYELFNLMVSEKVFFSTKTGIMYIAPHNQIIIPSGIKSKFGPELALIANNKSGIATKKQLIFGASVIDASYQGEWHINLHNVSNKYQTLKCGEKAVQFIPHLISTDPVEIVNMTAEEFYKVKSKRGEDWQGSTGTGLEKK